MNRVTDKLTPVTDRIYCCRSGSAADTQCIADIVKYNLDMIRCVVCECVCMCVVCVKHVTVIELGIGEPRCMDTCTCRSM